MRTLLATLRAEEQHVPSGLTPTFFRTFIHLLSQAIEHQPSTRFANARFGEVVQDTHGAIIGHFGVGVDIACSIHDVRGIVTVEQHIVPMPPGQFRHLSDADRASLASALEAFINAAQPSANPLWLQVLSDMRK